MRIVKKDMAEQGQNRKIKIDSAAKQLNEVNAENITTNNQSISSPNEVISNPVTKIQVETNDSSGKVAQELQEHMDKMEERRAKRKKRRLINTIINSVIVALIVLAFIINPTLNAWITQIISDFKDLAYGIVTNQDVSNNQILEHMFNIQDTSETLIYDGDDLYLP